MTSAWCDVYSRNKTTVCRTRCIVGKPTNLPQGLADAERRVNRSKFTIQPLTRGCFVCIWWYHAETNTRLAPGAAYCRMATRETAHSTAQGSGADNQRAMTDTAIKSARGLTRTTAPYAGLCRLWQPHRPPKVVCVHRNAYKLAALRRPKATIDRYRSTGVVYAPSRIFTLLHADSRGYTCEDL